MQARSGEGGEPFTDAKMMEQVRRIEMGHWSECFYASASLRRHRHRRVQKELAVCKSEHRHVRGQLHANETDWRRADPDALSEWEQRSLKDVHDEVRVTRTAAGDRFCNTE